MGRIRAYILIGLFVMLFACSDSPVSPEEDNTEIGKVLFKIDMSQAPSDVISLVGIISRNDYSTIPFTFIIDDSTQTASARIDSIPAGEWNLKVDALNYDSVAIYSGNTIVHVISGVTTPVNLFLNPTTGSIIINVQWGNGKTLSDLDKYLIGYWDFENNKLDDLSMYKNNGSIFGNANYTNGKKGDAISFSGYDGYALIPNDSVFYCEEKTISFWLYKNNDYILETEGKSDGEGVIAKAYDTGLNRDFTFAISGNKPRFHIYGTVGTENDTLIVSGKVQAISPQNWYHCVLVVGKNYTEFYLNGQATEYTSKPSSTINTSAPIVLGKIATSALPTRYFNGKIDEFRIYNKAFDSSEIQLLYNDAL